MEELPKAQNTIDDLPLKLRKIAQLLLQTDKRITLSEACSLLDLKYESITSMITNYKKKGLNFSEIVNSAFREYLHDHKLDISKSLVENSLNGSASHQKIFWQLSGDLNSNPEITVNNYTANVTMPQDLPSDILEAKLKEEDSDTQE